MTATSSHRPPVDDRILQRRQAVSRDNVRRRRRRLASVLALLLLGASVWAAAQSSLFAVTAVRVEGVSGRRAEAVRRVADVHRGDNLLATDLEAAARRVRGLPWVAEASAQRRPPSTVVVRVRPRRPRFAVRSDLQAVLVDAAGVVVPGGARPSQADEVVPVRVEQAVLPGPGVQVSDATVLAVLEIHAGLPQQVREAVAAYEAASPRAVRLRLRTAPVVPAAGETLPPAVWVRVGTPERVRAKAAVLGALLRQIADQQQPVAIAEIDVRAPDHPVIVPAG